MKLDLDALKQMGQELQRAYQVDGDLLDQLDQGLHVYSIHFEPSTGRVSAHIQWSRFRNLVANEADHPATYSVHEGWMHLSCACHGVEITTCLEKAEVVNMLKELVAEYPESDYEICEDDDIINLFTIWQNMTGWDLDWPEEVVTYG